jgi:putative MATE family efflux protein
MELRQKRSLTVQLMTISLPIMASNLLQMLYNMVDAFFLGKLGKEAISAPSITMNVSNFIIVFGAAFSIAGTTMISQAYGGDKDNKKRLDFLASQVFGVNLFMSLVVLCAGVLLSGPLLRLMQVPEGLTYTYTNQYMTIIFLAMPFFFCDMILRGTLQGIGDSLTPLYIQTVSVLINVILDPILIFGLGPIPAMEVAGAAWATLIARSVSCTISCIILFTGVKGVRVRLSLLRPDRKTYQLMTKIGLPASIGQSLSSLGFAVIQGVVNSFGPAVIAAFGIGNRVQSLFNMPAQGISQGVAILVGKKLGERKLEEAESVVRRGLWIIGIFISIGMGLVFVFGKYVIIFFVNDPEVVAHGVEMFRITTLSVVFFALYNVVCGAFQGGGITKPLMTMNLVRLWGLRVPLSYILPLALGLGPRGIWIAMLTSNVLVAIWSFILFKKDTWKVTIDFDS